MNIGWVVTSMCMSSDVLKGVTTSCSVTKTIGWVLTSMYLISDVLAGVTTSCPVTKGWSWSWSGHAEVETCRLDIA